MLSPRFNHFVYRLRTTFLAWARNKDGVFVLPLGRFTIPSSSHGRETFFKSSQSRIIPSFTIGVRRPSSLDRVGKTDQCFSQNTTGV